MNTEDRAAELKDPSEDRFFREIRGCIDLGMQREVFRLARRFLKRDPLEPEAFNAALDSPHYGRCRQILTPNWP